MIKLIDVDGNRMQVRTQGRLNTISQRKVLKILTQHTQHFLQANNTCLGENSQHSWSVEETGTLDTSRCFSSSSELDIRQQEISELNAISLPKEILQVHGFEPPTKAEGIVRLV